MRVVSLLPSATEIVVALGAGDSLVGISHSCDHPAVAPLPRVTRTRVPVEASSREIDAAVREHLAGGESLYTIDAETLAELEPDLVITQALCDVCAVTQREVDNALGTVQALPRVLSSEPHTLAQVLESILEIGAALRRDNEAAVLVERLRDRINAVCARTSARQRARPRVAFLEWLDPPMCAGHWNPELIALAGGVDGIGAAGEPSRRVEWDEVIAWEPDVLCVACCGYLAPRARRELEQILRRPDLASLPAVRSGQIHVFDGVGLFARPGPRIVDSLEALEGVLAAETRDERQETSASDESKYEW
jgi:iron complex transport system substrate-binding protein